MGDAILPIRQAIISKLRTDATLTGMVTGVFDFVPPKQAYPYVEIGESTGVPFRVFGRDGGDTTLTLHVWSKHDGMKEALSILGQVNTLLNDQPLGVVGYTPIFTLLDQVDTLKDPDGITQHVVVRYRTVVQNG